jgi:hypothetical protein
MGMALALPSDDPAWFEYFLNHRHHLPAIPIDYISYHFYASPGPDQTIDNWQYTFFDQAERFLTTVRYVEQIRKRLSPGTKTDTDELGVILPDEFSDSAHPGTMTKNIPVRYWNLAGGLYAHLFIQLSRIGVDVIGESQLVGYPSQFPSVTMIDWTNGKPNARYWVLKLLKDNFSSGDVLVDTQSAKPGIDAQAFATSKGRKILLVNERNRVMYATLPQDIDRVKIQTVDEASGEGPPRTSVWTGRTIRMAPFAVSVVEPAQ